MNPLLAFYVPKPEALTESLAMLSIAFLVLCGIAWWMRSSVILAAILMAAGGILAVATDVLSASRENLGDYGNEAREWSKTNHSDAFFAITAYFDVGRGKPMAFAGMLTGLLLNAALTAVRARSIRAGSAHPSDSDRPASTPGRLVSLVGVAILLASSECSAENRKMTFTYKKVGDLEIKADVYHDEGIKKQPVVVWIHGGALIMGHREGIDQRIRNAFAGNGTILVSIDYRLAPETPLPEIIADVEDAFRWVRERGPELFGADPDRIAVAGGSAGGYLTLTAGFRVKPRPVALVSLWGYGDLVGAWYSEPSPHARHHQSKLSRDEAYKQVAGPPISDARDRKGDGGAFYQYCRQQGSWPKAVSGWDPKSDEGKFVPFMPVRNVTAEYPPTLLIHGDVDTDVPFEQSTLMAAEFEKHKVAHRLIRLKGGEHGLTGADRPEIDEAYQAAITFIKERIR